MSSLAHSPTTFEVQLRDSSLGRTLVNTRLRLLPSGDGWALVGSDGRVVFHALGIRGRRRCLDYARAHGVLAVFS